MKKLLLIALLLSAGRAFGNACVASGTVTSTSATNWGTCGGTFPQPGDTVAIGNFNLTITAGTTFDIGTTPADDTTQVCCTTAAGTGQVIVGASAKFIYRGHMLYGVNGITFGAGSQYVHGGVGTQRYSSVCGNTDSSGCTITVNGTTGAGRVLWRKATSGLDGINGINSGGWQCPACFKGTNNLNASFLTVTDQGTSAIEAFVMPNNNGYASGRWTCTSCTWDGNGRITFNRIAAADNFQFVTSKCINPADTASTSCMLLKTETLTSGTRTISGSYIQDFSFFASVGTSCGLSVTNTVFRNFGAKTPLSNEGFNTCAWAQCDYLLIYNDSTTGGLNAQLPAGTCTHIIGLRTGGTPDSDIFESGGLQAAAHWSYIYAENQNTDEQGDTFVQHSDAITSTTAIEIDHVIAPCNDGNTSNGGFYTTVGAWPNARINLHNLTWCGNTSKGLADMENAAGPAGGFTALKDNLVYATASKACIFTLTAGGITAAAGTYVGADYNYSNNCTGSVYLKGNIALTAAAFSTPSPAGTHDQTSKNPTFNSQPRFLSWGQSINAGNATWANVIAEVVKLADDSGFTSSYSIQNAYTAFFAGWKPTNATAYRNSDSAGTGVVGANDGLFGCGSGTAATGVGCN